MWPWISAADPGRVHTEGRMARVALEDARERVAALLGTRPRQVIFTSGGTESINAAVYGALHSGRGVALAAIEHSAVREASARYAGHEVTLLVDGAGRILTDSVRVALEDADLGLVHCQWANHEVGTIQPVTEVVGACRDRGAMVHVDAAAAVGHLPVAFDDLGADLMSVSAHKLGGPRGMGALLVRRGLRIAPLLIGGALAFPFLRAQGAAGPASRTSPAPWASERPRPNYWPTDAWRRRRPWRLPRPAASGGLPWPSLASTPTGPLTPPAGSPICSVSGSTAWRPST